jgi:hypothetical protein
MLDGDWSSDVCSSDLRWTGRWIDELTIGVDQSALRAAEDREALEHELVPLAPFTAEPTPIPGHGERIVEGDAPPQAECGAKGWTCIITR